MPAFPDPSQRDPADHALLHPAAISLPVGDRQLQLGVMASGNGSNLEALSAAIDDGLLPARIRLLIVNNPGCGAQRRAERLGIPCEVVDHRIHTDRQQLDQQLVQRFRAAEVDGVVMAGWMRIVTSELIRAFPDRLVNIHPSLLPSFRGMDAVGQALRAGVRISGCSVHIVTEELDAGPIIAQAAVPVLDGDDRDDLTKRIQRQEHRLLPAALTQISRRWRQG